MIQFVCNSLKTYDPEKGEYIKCTEQLSSDRSNIGMMIKCPACGNRVVVPDYQSAQAENIPAVQAHFPAEVSEANSDQSHSERSNLEHSQSDRSNTKPKQKLHSSPKQVASHQSATHHKETNANETDTNESKATETGGSPVAVQLNEKLIHAPIASAEVPIQQPTIQTSSFTRGNTCRRCGTRIDATMEVCPRCNLRVPVDLRGTSDGKIRHRVTGFQLWLRGLFTDSNRESNFYAFVSLQAVIGVAAGLAILIFVALFQIAGLILSIPIVLMAALYFQAALKWRAMINDPRTLPNWWQKILWNMLLFLNRIIGWWNPFRGEHLRVLDCRYLGQLKDRDLLDIEGIHRAQVLDLQGQSITDTGILFLHERQLLRFVVLRKTNVTDEGVFQLQQALPKTWIWYL